MGKPIVNAPAEGRRRRGGSRRRRARTPRRLCAAAREKVTADPPPPAADLVWTRPRPRAPPEVRRFGRPVDGGAPRRVERVRVVGATQQAERERWFVRPDQCGAEGRASAVRSARSRAPRATTRGARGVPAEPRAPAAPPGRRRQADARESTNTHADRARHTRWADRRSRSAASARQWPLATSAPPLARVAPLTTRRVRYVSPPTIPRRRPRPPRPPNLEHADVDRAALGRRGVGDVGLRGRRRCIFSPAARCKRAIIHWAGM